MKKADHTDPRPLRGSGCLYLIMPLAIFCLHLLYTSDSDYDYVCVSLPQALN